MSCHEIVRRFCYDLQRLETAGLPWLDDGNISTALHSLLECGSQATAGEHSHCLRLHTAVESLAEIHSVPRIDSMAVGSPAV